MRAVKSVLTAAGQLKRKYMDENESILLLRAINDVNLAKFLVYDVPLFKGITSDLFPGIELPTPDYGHLTTAIKEQCEKRNLQAIDYFMTKVTQLYETICVRHGLMIVGRPFSGKSSAINVLADALTSLNQQGLMDEYKTITSVLNPKSVSMGQLYGNFDEISHDWSDGVLAVLYRNFANNPDAEIRKWLVFDGPVDAIWIENMNTVLDDNRKLCLMSGEIIQMSPNMNLIFEPMDLDVASPATVSRCGMIFLEPELMGWEPIFRSWLQELPEAFGEEVIKAIEDLVNWFIPPLIEFVRYKAHETTPTQDQNLVRSCLRILRVLIKSLEDDKSKLELPAKEIITIIDGAFMFSITWSVCASVTTEYRKACNDCVKKLLLGDLDTGVKPLKKIVFPDRGTIYDHIYFPVENKWKNWNELIDKDQKIPRDASPQVVIITTSDKMKYSWLLETFVKNRIPTLFVGPTGTGKSIYIQNVLQNVLDKDKFTTIEVGFSAQTSAVQTQGIIDGKLDKRRKDHFGPRFGMECVIHVDDLNMPKKEFYGAQPPVELLRQFLDQGGWFDLADNKHPFRNIIDTMLVCSMGPPGGGKTFITPRMQRHFNIVAFTDVDDHVLTYIFKTILAWWFDSRGFSQDVARMDEKIVAGTMKIYTNIQADLKPTPAKSHYTFNLRDISKVINGICMVEKAKCTTVDTVIRLWAHETMRVFGDRLINDDDRMWMLEAVKDTVRAPFSASFDTTFRHLDIDGDGKVDKLDEIRGLLFGDLMVGYGIQERPYEEILDIEACIASSNDALDQYNLMTDKPMNLVLFRFAVEHLIRISRILKQPGSHALLVGVGGSGRQSLTRLASKISGFQVQQIEIKKQYGMNEWRENIKEILRDCGGKGEITTFLFTDSQIKEEGFLEDINNILNTGEVPNLFPSDEKADVCELVRPAAKAENRAPDGTPAQLFSFFVEKCRKNLHIVLCFSPIGEALRNRIRNFPSLVNCTTIDWFSEWPPDALDSVAKKFLSEIEMDPSTRDQCALMVKYFHESTVRSSVTFLNNLKRHYYVTPTSYLEMIYTFQELLKSKRQEILGLKERYENGFDCLIKTGGEVSEMQKYLEELKPQLIATSEETDQKMITVTKEKGEADKIAEKVGVEEAEAQKIAAEVSAIKDDCETELNKAMPVLQQAEKALKCITNQDISYAKKLPEPPADVRMVLEAVCILNKRAPKKTLDPDTQKPVYDYWDTSKKMMNEIGFLRSLVDYEKEKIEEKTINALQKYIKNPKFNREHLSGVSAIAANLADWVIAMNEFYNVNLIVKPKQAALAKATKENDIVKAELAVKQRELKEVMDKVQLLEDDLNLTKQKKEDLENQVEDCTQKLDRAQKLIGGLGGEKKRWSETAANLKVVYTNLTGDVLVSSGMIAYLGAFTSAYRSELTTDWVANCLQREIPSSGKFNINSVLGDPAAVRNWTIFGLPSDQFSVENGIITSKARRWPLYIDPQGQANKWIINMEREREIKIIKFTDSDYMRTLETYIQFGKPVLLENVGEELDPSIEPLLQKQIFKKGPTWNIRFGDSTIEYSPDFKFYITTKLRNPHYLPETSTKVTLLNFMITYEGLSDQLLGILVAKEKPDLEMEKEKLVINGAKNKEQLEEIENSILRTLQNSENILADSKGVKVLSEAKVLSDKITKEQAEAEITEKSIDEARLEYEPVALRTSGLFFCISDLANIDPMYQYSLAFFIFLFTSAIQNSEQSDEIEERLKFLNDEFLISLYRNICRSLFEKDKLIFSFLLKAKLMEMAKELDQEEWRFLLTGGISLGEKLPPPPADWLEQRSWGELLRMCKLPAFKGFQEDFEANIDQFAELYESSNPQELEIPGGWHEKLSPFNRMIVIRCLRPDKVIPSVYNFVRDNLGQEFTDPPPFDLKSIYSDSTATTPLIFVLSPGSDPMNSLQNFATLKKKQLTAVSLGQGQGPIAQRHIKEGVANGHWVVLQNCHLAVTWMGTLEKICEELSPDPKKTNREFRLWLTSYPSKDFPVAVLQNGIKMTNEPPKGLKANLLGSYNIDPISNKDFFEACKKPKEWRKLLFGLCFFHGVIQERRNFGPLGWNIPYEFNESDLRISVKQVQMFLNEYPEKVPFDAIKYLTGECNYGGRVTDDKDRRLILCLLDDYYTEKIFDDDYKLSPSGIFYAPKIGDYESYIEYIRSLPVAPTPEVFGLHDNADITKDRNETNQTFEAILSTQNSEGGGESVSVEGKIIEVATKILSDFPEEYDIRAAEEKYAVSYKQSMNTVLTQELQRFNGLIKIIRSSLSDLKKAIAGEILLSAELETAMLSIFDGKVPELWMKNSFPSLKPLGGYVIDTKERLAYFQKWLDEGIPKLFHISKFYFTQGFLTGAKQNYARKTRIPIDELDFDFEVIQEDDPPAPVDGINIIGLYLEGCRWDDETRLLGESKPKVLFDKCPIIWLNPCRIKEMKNFPHYSCPVYKTSARRGTLSTTGHSTNFVMLIKLPSDQPEAHWIKRGVALLTQLDD